MRKRGWRPSKNWVALYAGENSDDSALRKSITSSGPVAGLVTSKRSLSVRNTTEQVATELRNLQLQEAFGKVASEMNTTSSRWYERLSSTGNRGVVLIVMGQPYSKANSRRLVTGKGGRPMFIKSQEALQYADDWRQQCPTLKFPLQGEIRVVGAIMYRSMQPDLDESLILDLAQGMIYKNDRQVMEKFFIRGVDTTTPRVVLLFEEREASVLE